MYRLFRTNLTNLTLIIIITNTFALSIFNHDNESTTTHRVLHLHSDYQGTSQNRTNIISSDTKAAAKTIACATISKGICISASALKYADKKLLESQ